MSAARALRELAARPIRQKGLFHEIESYNQCGRAYYKPFQQYNNWFYTKKRRKKTRGNAVYLILTAVIKSASFIQFLRNYNRNYNRINIPRIPLRINPILFFFSSNIVLVIVNGCVDFNGNSSELNSVRFLSLSVYT